MASSLKPAGFAHVLALSAASLVGLADYALAAEPQTRADLFDVGLGATVTSNTAVINSTIEAILGSPTGGPEPGSTFFVDAPEGTVHFIEWSTAQPVNVAGFNLHASGDVPNSPQRRAFDHFRLQAKVGDTFQTLYDEDVAIPYVFVGGQPQLMLSTAVTPTTAQEFRAEFTQHLQGQFFGPRVIELDGFPADACADANYNGTISASDALGALKAGVGSARCPLCVCDVDTGGAISASDALAILRSSVGSPATIECAACFLSGSTTTTTSSTTSTSTSTTSTTAPATSTTSPSTSTTLPTTSTTMATTTTTSGAVECDIDVAECTTTACTCGEAAGLDYHVGASGNASGPLGTEVRVNINAPQGGTIDCGDWTRIFGATVTGCDTIGCCRREGAQPESTQWSVFEVIDLPCVCPAASSPFQHNFLVQCQLRPGPVTEVEETSTPCP